MSLDCTPYLLSLGLTKGQTSLVWIAGPLSGLIVQPIVGAISDQSKSKWGRRRPFVLTCACIVSGGLVTLGFTKEIISALIADPAVARTFTIVLAVAALYATDFAINAVMSCTRSLMVDTLPIHKQQSGAAWISRMASLGHVIGYGAGAVDLVKLFGPALGDTQFKKLTVIAAASMLVTSLVTCWSVTERVLVSTRPDHLRGTVSGGRRRFKLLHKIWSTLISLPPRMQAICWIVFWSWIGWFPFLMYSSTWVGEIYYRFDAASGETAGQSGDALGGMGRIGSTALAVYSTVTFIGAWVLPPLVKSPEDETFTHRPPASVAQYLERFHKGKPDLLTVWFAAHIVFAAAMFLAPFATSFRFATALVALCGIPWTVATWAPTAFLGVEVNRLTGATENATHATATPATAAAYRRLSTSSDTELAGLGPPHDGDSASPRLVQSSSGELSGIYFGILNVYATIPQFLSTFMSTFVFAILEPGKSPELATDAHPSEHHSTDGPNAIAVCLFIGAISTLGAAYATRRLRLVW